LAVVTVIDEAPRDAYAALNSPVEVGLRALCLLTAGFPARHSLQRLTIYDYLVVHSDDVPGGPTGLHPQIPYRSGELLARRGVLQGGLLLYVSRGLIQQRYEDDGVFFAATEYSAGFLDALMAGYVQDLRDSAEWVVATHGRLDDEELAMLIDDGLGRWGAEFTMQSVLNTDAT
jgi:hypothetical protein